MPRRKQSKAICHDILESFLSRNNDLEGYWALGQLANVVSGKPNELRFHLREGGAVPSGCGLDGITEHYAHTLRRLMTANGMPQHWLADANIGFTMTGPTTAACLCEVTTDLGRTYRYSRSVYVRPHDPLLERRR